MRTRVLLVGLASIAFVGLGADQAHAGGGCHEAVPEEATTTVELQAMCMRPGVARVEPGATVTFTNTDELVHNLYGPGWFHGDLLPGASTTRTFDDPGTYTYACIIHPGMTGAVVVGEPQLVSSSTAPIDDDGSGSLAMVATLGGIALLGLGFAGGRRFRPRTGDGSSTDL